MKGTLIYDIRKQAAYLVIDFDVESLEKVDAFKRALAIAILNEDAAFVPERRK